MKRWLAVPFVAALPIALVLAMSAPAQAPLPLMELPPHVEEILAGTDPAFPNGGTLIEVRGQWRCDRPLSTYGQLPIVVNQVIAQNAQTNQPGAVRLGNTPGQYPADGCFGPGRTVDGPDADSFPECNFDQKADLFLFLNGNRQDIGSGTDLVKVIGGHCIEVGDPEHPGGQWIAGSVGPGEHQDCLNTNYGRDLHFYGLEVGDWETGTSGAHGAGGCWYMSSLRDEPEHQANTVCFECKLVASPHPGGGAAGTGFSLYGSFRSGMVDSCVAARRPFIQRADAIEPVNVNNYFVDTDATANPPFAGCPLLDDGPPPPPQPACSNGLDDDGDGLIDFPNDPGCEAAGDTTEAPNPPPPPPDPACSDGVDNDGDGLVDLTDPGCESAADDDETNVIPPPYAPACAPTCDEQIASLQAQVASQQSTIAELQAKIDAALAALTG